MASVSNQLFQVSLPNDVLNNFMMPRWGLQELGQLVCVSRAWQVFIDNSEEWVTRFRDLDLPPVGTLLECKKILWCCHLWALSQQEIEILAICDAYHSELYNLEHELAEEGLLEGPPTIKNLSYKLFSACCAMLVNNPERFINTYGQAFFWHNSKSRQEGEDAYSFPQELIEIAIDQDPEKNHLRKQIMYFRKNQEAQQLSGCFAVDKDDLKATQLPVASLDSDNIEDIFGPDFPPPKDFTPMTGKEVADKLEVLLARLGRVFEIEQTTGRSWTFHADSNGKIKRLTKQELLSSFPPSVPPTMYSFDHPMKYQIFLP